MFHIKYFINNVILDWNLFLALLIYDSSTIYLEWFKEEAYIEVNQSLILGKKYKTLIIKENVIVSRAYQHCAENVT